MKGRMDKPGIFFQLNSLFLMFGICQMVLRLIGLPLDPQKAKVSKLWGDVMDFCL